MSPRDEVIQNLRILNLAVAPDELRLWEAEGYDSFLDKWVAEASYEHLEVLLHFLVDINFRPEESIPENFWEEDDWENSVYSFFTIWLFENEHDDLTPFLTVLEPWLKQEEVHPFIFILVGGTRLKKAADLLKPFVESAQTLTMSQRIHLVRGLVHLGDSASKKCAWKLIKNEIEPFMKSHDFSGSEGDILTFGAALYWLGDSHAYHLLRDFSEAISRKYSVGLYRYYTAYSLEEYIKWMQNQRPPSKEGIR